MKKKAYLPLSIIATFLLFITLLFLVQMTFGQPVRPCLGFSECTWFGRMQATAYCEQECIDNGGCDWISAWWSGCVEVSTCWVRWDIQCNDASYSYYDTWDACYECVPVK